MRNIAKRILSERKYFSDYLDMFLAVTAFIVFILKVPFLSNFLVGYCLTRYFGLILITVLDDKLSEKMSNEIEEEIKVAQEKTQEFLKVQSFKQSLQQRGFVMSPKPPMKAD